MRRGAVVSGAHARLCIVRLAFTAHDMPWRFPQASTYKLLKPTSNRAVHLTAFPCLRSPSIRARACRDLPCRLRQRQRWRQVEPLEQLRQHSEKKKIKWAWGATRASSALYHCSATLYLYRDLSSSRGRLRGLSTERDGHDDSSQLGW